MSPQLPESSPLAALPTFGDDMDASINKTFSHLFPHLSANKEAILSTPLSTQTYLPSSRWGELDIYTPSNPSIKSNVILVFYYGGGLVHGSKQMGLMYRNLGHFFTSKFGFTVIVPDYRLVGKDEGAIYPSGGEDIVNALKWVKESYIPTLGDEGKDAQVFLMGQSAGGTHVLTFALESKLEQVRNDLFGVNGIKLRGIISISTVMEYDNYPSHGYHILNSYYGSIPLAHSLCPSSVLSSSQFSVSLPDNVKFYILHAELDPDWISEPSKRFSKLLAEKLGKERVQEGVMDWHNHVSPVSVIGSGVEEGEKWGVMIGEWIRTVLDN